ncbi:MAG: putative toxin-antitoxin system toxin component, PIN family [Actinomycetota bacterium]
MRVLLDTNVLVSAILFGGVPRDVLRAVIDGRIRIVSSAHLLDELEDILVAKFGFSKAAAVETRSELEVLADLVEPPDVPKVCRDPDDDHVLAAALTGRVDLIVTGDRDLLVLEWYNGLEIVTPAMFAPRITER